MLDLLAYAVLPYAALALLAGVPVARHLATAGRRSGLPAGRTAARRLYGGGRGGRSWRRGLAALAAAHLAGLALPEETPGPAFAAVEAAGFLAGLAALAGLARLLGARAAAAQGGEALHEGPAGNLLLTLTALGLTSGLTLAVAYGWGSTWDRVTLVPYLASLARLRPDVTLAADLPPLARLHVLGGFAALAALPFTRLGAFLASPLAALAGVAARLPRPRPFEEPDEDAEGSLSGGEIG